MLSGFNVFANIGVKNMDMAKQFYEGKLGLTPKVAADEGGVSYQCGGGTELFVYETEYAGTNQATTATWSVSSIESVVDDLKSKGISFEQYEIPNAAREGDVHVMANMKAAWFKDPDGNILCLHQAG